MDSTVIRQSSIFIWLAVVSLVVYHIASVQAAGEHKVTRIDELDVQRINVREPDGTLRMTISSAAKAPGFPWRGKDFPRPDRKSAGIIFVNDEGTENGGLIFGGERKNGKVSSYGHLSFDPYEQDQVVTLEQNESDGQHDAGLTFSDRPDTPTPTNLFDKVKTPEGRKELERLRQSGAFGYPRLFIGRTEDRTSSVVLKDDHGRPRLVIKVAPDGAATIDFLDEKGKVVRSLAPGN